MIEAVLELDPQCPSGGFEKVTGEKKWQKVADDMGYPTSNKNIANLLRAHYERIIYPLDVFEQEEQKKAQTVHEIKSEVDEKDEKKVFDDQEKEYTPHNIPTRMGMKVPAEKDKAGRRSKRYNDGDSPCSTPEKGTPVKKEDEKNSFSKELARLQFVGAGPKMAALSQEKAKEKTRGMKLTFEYDPVRNNYKK